MRISRYFGCPDNQQLGDEADAYHELTDNVPVLRIGNARSGRGWVLALDGSCNSSDERFASPGLARTYLLQGDTAKAAYQDFLTLWKDADPDIPILIAAKVEYAKLN